MILVIGNYGHVDEVEGFKTLRCRKITDKELIMYKKAIEFVDNFGINDLARLHIVETDEYYDEDNIDAEFSCLIIDEGNYYIELSEKLYPVDHIRVVWNDDVDKFELYE